MKRLATSAVIACALTAACAAEIGDSCDYDADCSLNMERNCDHEQPRGYCLIISCVADECPNESVCVEFTTPCPDGVDEETCRRIAPNRGRTYCLRHCNGDGGCRSQYTCTDPEELYASIIDLDPRGDKVCVPDV